MNTQWAIFYSNSTYLLTNLSLNTFAKEIGWSLTIKAYHVIAETFRGRVKIRVLVYVGSLLFSRILFIWKARKTFLKSYFDVQDRISDVIYGHMATNGTPVYLDEWLCIEKFELIT